MGRDLWAFAAEGDPNSGASIGSDGVIIVEAQATPRLAQKVIEKMGEITDKPIAHSEPIHSDAVRVPDASACGAPQITLSEKARAMLAERGQQDRDGEFPHLFEGHESIPRLTWHTTTFNGRISVCSGKQRIDVLQPGRIPRAVR